MIKPIRYWVALRPLGPKSWAGLMPDIGIETSGHDMHEALHAAQREFRLWARTRLEAGEDLLEPGAGCHTLTDQRPDDVVAALDYRIEPDLAVVRVAVIMTAGERDRIDRYAKRRKLSTSEFLRQAALAAVDARARKK
jgi:hypothetical protein